MILLNRPFLQYWKEMQWQPSNNSEPPMHPQRLCIDAATTICATLSHYNGYLTRFPCDIIFPIVLSAAIIWQFDQEIDMKMGADSAHEKLELCVKCLSIVSDCWQNAGKYREKLVTGAYLRPLDSATESR